MLSRQMLSLVFAVSIVAFHAHGANDDDTGCVEYAIDVPGRIKAILGPEFAGSAEAKALAA